MKKLPAVTLRKPEVAAMVEVLESPDHSNADEAAKAALKKAYELLLARDWYVLAERNDGRNLLAGFFATENAAIKNIPNTGMFGEVGIFKVRSLVERMDQLEALDEGMPSTACKTCGHQQAAHEFKKTRGGCIGKGCNCASFVKM